ncbi:hypothetical protein TOPH_00509 [Tolypocladium ophioglossoides CBS 100239]|uniref:Uncharacterized protein n=1 Tax=Tolypocladium ophioglossoides (strain CBS 100239) TaxID=1163406 RepID=A0A0L0NME4_TOLOC|nr:hypothetical protein TOPH_00509 [Tolypocladium ophioglossoides CBS 100239]
MPEHCGSHYPVLYAVEGLRRTAPWNMYATTQEPREQSGVSLAGNYRMGIRAITHAESLPARTFSEDLSSISRYRSLVHPQTPPESTSGSPRLKFEGTYSGNSRDCSPLPSIGRLNNFTSSSPVRLPSLEEFDQGVEALARSHGPARPYTPPSPLPSLARGPILPHPLPHLHGYASHDGYPAYHMNDHFMHAQSGLDSYPSPPPDGENRHINQKYTTEEGDFIIYAWHDKKLKWQRIKQDFAAMFGRTPERTVQGLQAWYYRMNQRIPLWDQDGWLIFDNEDDLEPKHISIKCRERDSQDKPMEPLGLAQRYPERAIHYSWVEPDLKRKSQDWAAKRALQYRERRERRKRKEQRRLKL